MSDTLIRQIDRNIETLEMLEKEYSKRAKPRARLISIRSALNNGIVALKQTKAKYEKSDKDSQTNADRIRSMSDEELAGFITEMDGCLAKTCVVDCSHEPNCYECKSITLKWLQLESEVPHE
ncbi:hypothetical protein ACTQ6A_14155 [Lachnospiraceae bacterium LCP25S3_G4]